MLTRAQCLLFRPVLKLHSSLRLLINIIIYSIVLVIHLLKSKRKPTLAGSTNFLPLLRNISEDLYWHHPSLLLWMYIGVYGGYSGKQIPWRGIQSKWVSSITAPQVKTLISIIQINTKSVTASKGSMGTLAPNLFWPFLSLLSPSRFAWCQEKRTQRQNKMDYQNI